MTQNRRRVLQAGVLSAALIAGASAFTLAKAADEPIKIGILIPGSKADHGWMESGYNGMKEAEKRYGKKIKVTYIENVKFADMEQALVTLAMKNDLVIGGAGQTQASVLKVAKRFPKVKFSIVGPTGQPTENVAQYDVLQAQIGYIAGAVAAMMSKNGAVSYVGGLEIPAIVNTGKEFCNGAKNVKPDVKCIESYTGDFDDVAKAKEATLAAIAQGADVHYNILNLGVRGMEQAAREKGTKMIGSYTNYRLHHQRHRLHVRVRDRPDGRWHLAPRIQAVRSGDGSAFGRHQRLHRRDSGNQVEDQGAGRRPVVRQDQGSGGLIKWRFWSCPA